jgi:antitoxin HicB
MAKKPKRYTVTDGRLVLVLELDEEIGGYCVTSPFNPDIITQADTLEEAFEMARDCAATMRAARAKTARTSRKRAPRRSAR